MKTNIRIMLQRKSFWISFALMLAISFGSYLRCVMKYAGMNIDNAPDNSALYFMQSAWNVSMVIVYISLFLIVMPYANAYVLDRKNNTQLLYRSRERNWYLKQFATAVLGAFIILIIPAVFSVVWNGITFHSNGNLEEIYSQGKYIAAFFENITGENIIRNVARKGFYLRRLAYFYPQMYNAAYALMYAVSGAILAGFAYAVSLYLGKIRVMVYVVPFALIFFLSSFDGMMYNIMPSYISTVYPEYVSVGERLGVFYPAFWALHAVLALLSIVFVLIKEKCDEL